MVTREWNNWFLSLSTIDQENLQAEIDALTAKINAIPGGFNLKAIDSIAMTGNSTVGGLVQISLVGDVSSPISLTFYGSLLDNDAGWHAFSDNFVDNLGFLDLSQPAIASGGTLSLLGFDVYGRLSETGSATSDNLPEGQTNLYDAPIVAIAIIDLDSPRVVAVDGLGNAYYPDLSNPIDVECIVGVTLHAAAMGTSIQIVTSRDFYEPAWGWSLGRIYCATTGGTLTQAPPTSPSAIVEVARVISPTTIRVGIQPAIII